MVKESSKEPAMLAGKLDIKRPTVGVSKKTHRRDQAIIKEIVKLEPLPLNIV